LLTRSRLSAIETKLTAGQYHHVCWYEVYNWLAESQIDDPVCRYFGDSLMVFLEGKRMSMKKVTWEYMAGVPSMMNLTEMLETAITEASPGTPCTRTSGWTWRGFRLQNGLWCGMRYHLRLLLVMENNGGNTPTFKRDLDLEKARFFALTKDEQFELLVGFVRQAYAEAPNAGEAIQIANAAEPAQEVGPVSELL